MCEVTLDNGNTICPVNIVASDTTIATCVINIF